MREEETYKEYFCYAAVYLPKPEKCLFPQEWFGEPVKVEFEGRQFSAPQNWDAILKKLYRDYMQLPPEEQLAERLGVSRQAITKWGRIRACL